MKIFNISNYHSVKNPASFKAAQINILASSDNHGNLSSLPAFLNTIKENKSEIFTQADKDSTLNLFINAGDFFINPSKRGYFTHPLATNGDIQKSFLQKLIKETKKLLPENSQFKAIYTPGNHCFDGGDEVLMNLVNIPGMTTVLTNVDRLRSPALRKSSSKILKSREFVVPDSEDPNYKHHILMIGATIPTMKFYAPGLVNGITFYNDVEKKDAQLDPEDLEETFKVLNDEVEQFKKRHPNGVVLFSSHLGTKISKLVRERVKGINETFDAHQHDVSTITKGSSNISSLGQDNEIVKSISLTIEKNGEIERVTNTYFVDKYKLDGKETNAIKRLLDTTFQEDIKPLVTITDNKGQINELPYEEDIRYANSYLANYLTSAVKRSVRKIVPDIDVVGIQSSIIRGGLESGSTNLDLMKIFDGVSEDLSGVQVGEISGEDLIGLIVENVKDNLQHKTRNTIIHWSDIKVSRTMIDEILTGKNPDGSFADAVKIRNPKSKNAFIPIEPKKKYKIAIAEKYLVKDDIKSPAKIRGNFVPIKRTYDQLFREYLESINYQLLITDKTKEKRIS